MEHSLSLERNNVKKYDVRKNITHVYSYHGSNLSERLNGLLNSLVHSSDVSLIVRSLRNLGLSPKVTTFTETDQIGFTGLSHSFIHFPYKGKEVLFETSLPGYIGMTTFDSEQRMIAHFSSEHRKGNFGDNKEFNRVKWSDDYIPEGGITMSTEREMLIGKALVLSALNNEEDYLEHHGVLGQKWGRKNGPPYPLDSSLSTGSSLKKEARAEEKRVRQEEKAESYKKKATDKVVKEYVKVHEKALKRSMKYGNKALEAEAKGNIKKANKMYQKGLDVIEERDLERIRATLEIASIGNMTVEDVSKEKRAKGAAAVTAIVGSAASVAVMTHIGAPIAMVWIPNMRSVERNSRLRDEKIEKLTPEQIKKSEEIVKIGEKAVNQMLKTKSDDLMDRKKTIDSANKNVALAAKETKKSASESKPKSQSTDTGNRWNYTSEEKQAKLRDAKKNDYYDLYFLEAIQNTEMSYNNNKTQINKAYEKYLDDPDKFFETVPEKYKMV